MPKQTVKSKVSQWATEPYNYDATFSETLALGVLNLQLYPCHYSRINGILADHTDLQFVGVAPDQRGDEVNGDEFNGMVYVIFKRKAE